MCRALEQLLAIHVNVILNWESKTSLKENDAGNRGLRVFLSQYVRN